MNYVSLLANDHYQLSMMFAHWRSDRETRESSMEFYCRKLPKTRRFLVAAGLFRILEHINHIDFTSSDFISYIRNHDQLGPVVSKFPGFVKYLRELDKSKLLVHAMKDGDIFFPNEPVLRIAGPTPILHLLETMVCGILNHDVGVASKAARIAIAAGNRELLEFGTRRGDPESSPHAALAAVIGGFHKTSNCDAGRHYGIPVVGTMAHSWVQSYGISDEFHAFKDFLMAFGPEGTSLLIDTYDIITGLHNACAASKYTGVPLRAVRLDSGEPVEKVPQVRSILDRKGFTQTKIIITNDFDEYKIASLPKHVFDMIDTYGIGSAVRAPTDATSLGFVGKLVETGYSAASGNDTIKISADPAKSTWPGRKTVKRHFRKDEDGMYIMDKDVIHSYVPGGGYASSVYHSEVKPGDGPDTCMTELLSYTTVKDVRLDVPSISQRVRRGLLELPDQLRDVAETRTGQEYPVTFDKDLSVRRDNMISNIKTELEKQAKRYEL